MKAHEVSLSGEIVPAARRAESIEGEIVEPRAELADTLTNKREVSTTDVAHALRLLGLASGLDNATVAVTIRHDCIDIQRSAPATYSPRNLTGTPHLKHSMIKIVPTREAM